MTPIRHRLRAAALLTALALVPALAGCTGATEPTPSPSASPEEAAPDDDDDATDDDAEQPVDDDGAADDGDDPTDDAEDDADGSAGEGVDGTDGDGAAPGSQTVTPFVAYAGPGSDPGTIEVNALIPDLVEDGGECSVTLVDTTVTATSTATADATSTVCGPLILQAAPAAGQSVVVTYLSETASGASATTAVTP